MGCCLLEAMDDAHTHVHVHYTDSLAPMNNYPGFRLYYTDFLIKLPGPVRVLSPCSLNNCVGKPKSQTSNSTSLAS